MARGPLPHRTKRRRNKATIPTSDLPVDGFDGAIPDCPYQLAVNGAIWWAWAWRTPQAAGWSEGDLFVVARRAQLEDDIAVLDAADSSVDLADYLGCDGKEIREQLLFFVGRLKAMAAGRITILREQRELDNKLGLTPKGLADLRWKIIDTKPVEEDDDEVSKRRAEREARLGA